MSRQIRAYNRTLPQIYVETRDGQRMGIFSRLLDDAISSFIAIKEAADLFSFLDGVAVLFSIMKSADLMILR